MQKLAVSGEDKGGILLTNFPVGSFLSYENLKVLREDVIVARVMGLADGGPALDYTVNCALGLPIMTGPKSIPSDEPVNHVLPAWDLLAGAYAAFTVLAAERHRKETGRGGDYRIPLSDLGISTMANLGNVAEVLYKDENRPRHGNELYGAFGKDFNTKDNRRLIVMALTPKQWKALVHVLDIESEIEAIETERGVSFKVDEGVRYQHADILYPLVEAKIATWRADDLGQALDEVGGCWGEYKTLKHAVNDPALVTENPIFEIMKNPSGFTYPTSGAAVSIPTESRLSPKTAPKLGADTLGILTSELGMSASDIDELIKDGTILERD